MNNNNDYLDALGSLDDTNENPQVPTEDDAFLLDDDTSNNNVDVSSIEHTENTETNIDNNNEVNTTNSDNTSNKINESNTFRIVIGNQKGGVGKSTVATQLIAPYLYTLNHKKVNLFEFDSNIKDCETFFGSQILNPNIESFNKNNINDKIINSFTNDDNIVIDIGGNSITNTFLESLISTNYLYAVDLFVIPLTDGEKDALNALKIYKQIKASSPNLKFLFVLNKFDPEGEDLDFIDFYGDKNGFFDSRKGVLEEIDETDRNIVKLYSSKCIKFSRLQKCTIFELAHANISSVIEEQKKAIENKDFNRARFLTYKNSIVKDSKVYFSDVIKPSFDILNNLLNK